MANELQTINPETMAATVQSLPEITAWIAGNHDRGLAKGKALLDTIEANGGLDAETDEAAKAYIEAAGKCKSKMFEMRSPVTQLMDQYRKVFTSLEGDFDKTNTNTIPGKLQALRNKYAAELKAKAEAEARKAQEVSMQLQVLERYKQSVLGEFVNKVTAMTNQQVGYIRQSFENCNLENYDQVYAYIENMPEHFTLEQMVGNLCMHNGSAIPLPQGFPADFNFVETRMKIYTKAAAQQDAQYNQTIKQNKASYLEMLQAKKKQMELAKVDAEAAKAKAEEIKRHQEEEDRRIALEQQQAAEKARKEAELASQQGMAMSLFGNMEAQAAQPAVKTKTKKVIKIDSKNGYLQLLNFWWVNEGQNLDLDELAKVFKKMVTYAEKRANAKDPEFIQGEGITFEDEVIAK